MTIFFDMDGTLNKFYDVPNWLDMLLRQDVSPYLLAEPAINAAFLAKQLNQLQKAGIKIGIISWLAKNGTESFNKETILAKEKWLKRHFPTVFWNEIHIVPFGFAKETFKQTEEDILFDDTPENVFNWGKGGFAETAILKTLKKLV